jgi:predicted nuclease of predicted toxin-antitoxin system
MRDAGHDVVYVGERAADPGDEALLAEAVAEGRTFLTKDHDLGALVYRDSRPHRGVLLLDDLGDAAAEAALILAALSSHGGQLANSAFLRVGPDGARESRDKAGSIAHADRRPDDVPYQAPKTPVTPRRGK